MYVRGKMNYRNGKMSKSPRSAALEILLRMEEDKSYSNLLLDRVIKDGGYSHKDAAMITALVHGVLENRILLDYAIGSFSNRSGSLKPLVLNILRLGVYQISFLDRVPDSAAVDESVKLSKKYGAAYASGYINAVLRAVSRTGNLPLPGHPGGKKYISVRYSCPKWLFDQLSSDYSTEQAVKILSGAYGPRPVFLRVNTLKTTQKELIGILESEGVAAQASEETENAVSVSHPGALTGLDSFKNGLFHVQGLASQICCMALGAVPGSRVLDLCAAPGGKSHTIAQIMRNSGTVYSLDLYENRLSLIKSGAGRLGISIVQTGQNDASRPNPGLGVFDSVLCDVPCSGLGVLGRKPEIRYKDPFEFDKLPDLQYAILVEGASHVCAGGTLVYSTCTLSKRENEEIVDRFLTENTDFSPLPLNGGTYRAIGALTAGTDLSGGFSATCFPDKQGCDGFFFAVMQKRPGETSLKLI